MEGGNIGPNHDFQLPSSSSPLLVVVGPTASGKTALAVDLARQFGGEIICADSRTVYKGADIGTAKPSKEDQAEIRHHLLDVVNPDERFTAADFKELAQKAIEDIRGRSRLPIVAGGTGLYIDALLFDYGFSAEDSPRDAANPRHLDKAVPRIRKPLPKDILIIGMQVEKETLRQRIRERVDIMVAKGFEHEVAKLMRDHPDSKVLLAPGYKAFSEYLAGRTSLEEAKALFIQNDMRLAKRQMTWFRRNRHITWVNNPEKAVDLATTFLNKKP
jgi:tRNA dimethylallyltransferase